MSDSNEDKKEKVNNEVDEHPLNSTTDNDDNQHETKREEGKKQDDKKEEAPARTEAAEITATTDIDLATEDDGISQPMQDLVVQDLDVKDESTEAWKQDTTASNKNNHPLESVVDNVEVDPWAQQKQEQKKSQDDDEEEDEDEHEDISLLDNEESHTTETPSLPPRPPIVVAPPPATRGVTAAAVAQVENVDMQEVLDNDTSHVKGFFNTEDSSEIVDLEVTGQLPDWLICEHFTVGPGTYDIKYMRKMEIDGELQHVSQFYTFGHWFDSLPLVNRFDIHGQRNSISYRNKLTCKRLISKIRDNHGYSPRHPAGLFKTKTNQTVLTKLIGGSGGGNKGSKADAEPCGARILSNIPGLEGRLFCQNFANHIQELDPFDMKPTRLISWNEINPAFKGYSSCANGHHDPRTGEYINFTMEVGYQSTRYHFFTLSDRNPKGTVIGSINAPTSYVNSFSITRSYIILVIFPHQANGMKYAWNESILDSFSFKKSQPTLFYVLSRESGKHIVTFRSEACFAFHHINAFEDDNDNIYLDMICYSDDTIAHQLTTDSLRNPSNMKPSRLAASEVRRYVLNTVSYYSNAKNRQASVPSNGSSGLFGAFRRSSSNTNSATSSAYSALPEAAYEKLLPPSIELPQINPNYKMHHYNYLYGLGFSASSAIGDGKIWDSIIKMNVNTRSVMGAWYEKDCYPSEAVFIPRPSNGPEDEVGEDDGVLLSIVMDSARATSFLLVLDATSLSVLAKSYLGTLVPLSFGRGSYRLYTL